MSRNSISTQHTQDDAVITKALLNMAAYCDLKGKVLSEIIGISEASASRLHQGTKFISPKTKEGEITLLLLRLYRSLNAILGNNHDKIRIWLNSPNRYFKQKPIEHIKKIDGLVNVVNYLDATRGKL